MEVLKENCIEWKAYVDNNEKVIKNVCEIIKINEEYYNTLPFSMTNGYGFKIFLFKSSKDFIDFMIKEKLFGRVVEFVDIVDEGTWICLSYLLSSDSGIVIYFQT